MGLRPIHRSSQCAQSESSNEAQARTAVAVAIRRFDASRTDVACSLQSNFALFRSREEHSEEIITFTTLYTVSGHQYLHAICIISDNWPVSCTGASL